MDQTELKEKFIQNNIPAETQPKANYLDYLVGCMKDKKSHTCEEGGSTPQNFFLAFIYELEKQIIIKKNCRSGPIKTK